MIYIIIFLDINREIYIFFFRIYIPEKNYKNISFNPNNRDFCLYYQITI